MLDFLDSRNYNLGGHILALIGEILDLDDSNVHLNDLEIVIFLNQLKLLILLFLLGSIKTWSVRNDSSLMQYIQNFDCLYKIIDI